MEVVEETGNLSNHKEDSFFHMVLKKIVKGSLNVVKKLEDLGAYWPLFGKIYCNLFYTKLVKKELKAAGIESESSILHIGCGSLPMTALGLGELGYSVTGVDSDKQAVKLAQKVVNRRELASKIKIKKTDGGAPDSDDFAGIWVSLHAMPKKELISKLMDDLSLGQKLVFRNPKGSLDLVYPRIEIADSSLFLVQKLTHITTETVIVEKKAE